MKLNCDIGESFGQWQLGQDDKVMPLIDMANIACGFHAGDPLVIKRTLQLAKQHKLQIGAHPSYPDLQGFGRRSLSMPRKELIACIQYQIAALDGMALTGGQNLDYVKPHGALYNDMMQNEQIFDAVLDAVANFYKPLKLMVLSQGDNEKIKQHATQYQVSLLFEAFADRAYQACGALVPRQEQGAMLNKAQALKQVAQLINTGTMTTLCGNTLTLEADTLCVHGDNPEAVLLVKEIVKVIKARCP